MTVENADHLGEIFFDTRSLCLCPLPTPRPTRRRGLASSIGSSSELLPLPPGSSTSTSCKPHPVKQPGSYGSAGLLNQSHVGPQLAPTAAPTLLSSPQLGWQCCCFCSSLCWNASALGEQPLSCLILSKSCQINSCAQLCGCSLAGEDAQ